MSNNDPSAPPTITTASETHIKKCIVDLLETDFVALVQTPNVLHTTAPVTYDCLRAIYLCGQDMAARLQAPTPDRAKDLVPGVVRCARCDFRLTRTTLFVGNGTVAAGGNHTEPCPNGCGPLWPITWEQEARETYAVAEQMLNRCIKAEKALAALLVERGLS